MFYIGGLISTNGGVYMTIRIDNRHLYLQVIDRLKEDIEKGVFKEKEKLPSEFELAKIAWSKSCNVKRSSSFIRRRKCYR